MFLKHSEILKWELIPWLCFFSVDQHFCCVSQLNANKLFAGYSSERVTSDKVNIVYLLISAVLGMESRACRAKPVLYHWAWDLPLSTSYYSTEHAPYCWASSFHSEEGKPQQNQIHKSQGGFSTETKVKVRPREMQQIMKISWYT